MVKILLPKADPKRPTPPTPSPSPSPTPTTARRALWLSGRSFSNQPTCYSLSSRTAASRSGIHQRHRTGCGSGSPRAPAGMTARWRFDRQAQGRDRQLWRGLRDPRRARRRLCRALLVPHPAAPAAGRRGGDAVHRDPCPRGHDPPVRLPLATRSASGSACSRPSRASAPRWRSASSPSSTPAALATAIATGDKASVARAPGVGPSSRPRIVAELKDKAPAFGAVDPALIRARRRRSRTGSAPRPGHRRRLGPRQSRLRPGPGLGRRRRRAPGGG